MDITLDALKTDKMAVVTHIETDEASKKRLRAYGLVPGTIVRCRYRSPGGGVMALELRGSVVALRAGDLKKIRGCGL
jgi:Fe2+ transport system protein FeoA